MGADLERVLISEEEIQAKLTELAGEIADAREVFGIERGS